MGDPRNVKGMAAYGINPDHAFGISLKDLMPIAKRIGKNHALALALWGTGIREARIIAMLVEDADELEEEQMDRWASDFDSWDVCDGCCIHLFGDSPLAWRKAVEWSKREEEFVKRAGYALMAVLAVRDKRSPDSEFVKLLRHIRRGAKDERNYVKKSVNWALRQIGKRNFTLNHAAVRTAEEILALDTKAARWVARNALMELRCESVKKRLAGKAMAAHSR